ncbi:MAG TPA: extracellular solute-binding protein [Terriglobales bacterium]|jgi:iron(III) transport system substrate-binding protein|nr:extracellular solute-binding protein [Terriglobales bacterium]
MICGKKFVYAFPTVLMAALFASSAYTQPKKPATLADLAGYTGADREQLLFSGAKSEGKVVWYTSLAGGSYKAIVDAFEAKYPGVKVEVYRASGAELTVRLSEEAKARRYLADALETTEEPLAALFEAGMIAPFTSPYLRNYPEQARKKADKGLVYWANARESYVGFAYNKTRLPASAVPKNFDGLLNPELKGRLAFGSGGTAPEIVGAMVKAKGEAFVKKLKGQEIRLFSMGSPAIRDQIAVGEIEAAPVIFRTHAIEAAEKGAPIEWLPMDLVPVHAGAAILAARAPHPHAALLMVDFLLSPEGQGVLEKFKYGSAAKDYGFKRWYFTAGLNADQLERQVTSWEKLMQGIVKKGG